MKLFNGTGTTAVGHNIWKQNPIFAAFEKIRLGGKLNIYLHSVGKSYGTVPVGIFKKILKKVLGLLLKNKLYSAYSKEL